MKFEEVKRHKDGRLIKPRDPNFKTMQDLKKSGAAGSHGDKTKEIPRKAKYKDEFTNEDVQHLTELAFLPLLIPALATAARIGAPHVLRLLGKKGAKELLKKGAQSGAGAAANVAKNAKPLIQKGAEAAGKGAIKGAGNVVKGVGKAALKHPVKATLLGVGTKVYMEVDELIDDIKELVGDMLDIKTIKAIAQVAVKWALPAAAIVAILYGGKKLYDYLSDDPEPQPQEDIEVPEDGWKDDYKVSRLLGKAQASMAHGLELAEAVLKGDKDMSIIKARVIKENWPELIDQLNKVYDTKTDLNSIHEYVDDRVGTVVKTVQGKRVKIVQADPKKGVYKVDLGNGHEKWVTTKQLDLEVPMDALGKKAKPRSDLKHPWDSDPKESKEEMCPEACCGVPVSECKCPPDCPHCDCNAINEKVGDTWNVGDKFLINPDDAPNKKLTVDKIKGNKLLGSNTKWYSKYAVTKANMSEDLDSPSHKAQSSIWHKNNPMGRNFMNPDDYDSDAPGTHIIMDNPTELHFYKIPAKNYDEAFDKWLDGKSYGEKVSDHEFYDSTKDYASDHQYWGRIAPDEPEPEDDDEEFETLTTEQIAGILEADFAVKDIEDYRAKIKTLYGLERYMKDDPELADEVRRRYRQLASWKREYDAEHQEDYETQIYDSLKTETATAGATSAGAIATVANPTMAHGHRPKDKKGLPKAPQKKKADGTAVNALDMGNNLMGGATVKR
jgi:hypothetical protein